VRADAIEVGLWALLGLVVVAGAAILLQRLTSDGPARWRVEGNVLVVMDSGGRELWQFSPDPAIDSRLYSPERVSDGFSPLWAGDLDGDHQAEVLFPLRRAGSSGSNDELICFDSSGRIKWRYRAAGKVRTREQEFTGPWQVRSFLVISDGNERKQIVLTVAHRISFPTHVVLLDASGRQIRDYWHAGLLSQLHYGDFDGDRRGEVYLGGLSTAYKSAELLVLDPETFEGASREIIPKYQFLELASRKEKARLLFARTELNRRTEEFNSVSSFQVSDGQLVAAVREFNREDPSEPVVLYYFEGGLRLTKIEMTDGARASYRQAASLRLIPPLDPDLELPSLASGVRILTPWR
jgi:hypothetical protein